ncbi:MAG TPA: trypsin-like peptidase domain-containing protein [Candidatus Baltobacteraceae bacterium]|jgi:S1-C subfamily serine protease|nr:trypsin-like peptidase domain-containing protein [Candidatus Baltobacteraceae bacterium]
MLRNRLLPTAIIALVGAVIGAFVMMLYASTHFTNVAGPNDTPPAVSAAPLSSGGSDQDRIVNAVKRAKPSVVAINITVNGKQFIPVDPFFQQILGQQGPGLVQPYQGRASGSGFVFDNKGDIVTNAHVARPDLPNAQVTRMTVTFPNGTHANARLIAANIGADLAVVRVDVKNMPPPLSLADSDRLQQGQWAIAIGEPYELQQSVAVGVVSAFNRSEPIQTETGQTLTFKGLMQTSAPINPGNSGGPLIDVNGEVIGVNQSTLRGGAEGIGFAIPSNTVRRVVAEMIAHPGITQPPVQAFLGVGLAPITQGFRSQTNYHGDGGVGVAQVVSGSAADQAGLNPGDVILKLNGKSYNNPVDLQNAIRNLHAGQKVTLEIWSQASGAKRLVTLTLGSAPADTGLEQQPPQDQNPDGSGP